MYKKVHYCSLLAMLLHRKVHVLYAKNLPAKLPGYGLGVSGACSETVYFEGGGMEGG